MSDVSVELHRRKGDYGIDGDFEKISAGWVLTGIAAILVALVAATVWTLAAGLLVVGVIIGVLTLGFALFQGTYLWTTLIGKFRVWARILGDLGLRGDEQVLDLGCGRGALLLTAARLLPRGRAVGIDLWTADQSGNSPEATARNAELEGVADRIELHTGDITTRLPFADNAFDLIISSLVVHNIPSAEGRRAAIDEAVRVLRPGGRIVIADLLHTRRYVTRLRELGLTDIHRRSLGPNMWWGSPLLATQLVTATMPA